MAVESGTTTLGSPLPDITLPDVGGVPVTLADLRGDGILVVAFVCNHCPYVRHVETRLGQVYDEFATSGVGFAAIMSNDVSTYPDDDVPGMREQAHRAGWSFPYLIDSDQTAARTLGAVCTPDFFLFDRRGTLAYRGAFDSSSPKNGNPLTGELLRDAIGRTLKDESVPSPHPPALGCGIKWRQGNEPEAVGLP